MYTKAQKTKLTKVCKVLFPEYKSLVINTDNVIFHNRTSREFRRRWKLSTTELFQFQIPQKLTLFKYGNVTFLKEVIEELTACDLKKQDRLDYFYNELVKIKFSEVYKQLEVREEDVVVPSVKSKRVLDDMVISYSSKTKSPLRMKLSDYAKIIGNDVIACFSVSIVFTLYLILR